MKNFQAGRFVQQAHHKSFLPNPINREWGVEDMGLLQLLGRADRELGRLDMYSEYIPNIDLFIRMHVLKEASQSSKIEGTQTTKKKRCWIRRMCRRKSATTGKRCRTTWTR
jgi:Fic family protein